MICIKVLFSDGDYILTRFRGSIDTARRYYIGRTFNTGVTTDRLVQAVAVEIIETEG